MKCGEFIGGSDIMIEMYQSGELGEMIEKVSFTKSIGMNCMCRPVRACTQI